MTNQIAVSHLAIVMLHDETNGLLDLDTCKNQYNHPCTKDKGVHGFQGDLNSVSAKGFILWLIKLFLPLTTKLCSLFSLATKVPSNSYSSNF